MAYQDETTRRLYVSESPLLADDTNYQFVSSDVDDDTETARVNAMQAAYEDLRLRGADVEGGGGNDDELEAEARYQEALRERLGKPPPQPQRRQQQPLPPPPQLQPLAGSSVAAAAARRYGVPKLDLRDSVDESRNYDEYAAVEDSLDFETPRAAAGGTTAADEWSDPPPNPFALSAAAPLNAGNLAKPTVATKPVPVVAAEPPRQVQQRPGNSQLPRPLLRPIAPPVGADAFAYGNVQPPHAQQHPHPAQQQVGLFGQLADDSEHAWPYRQSPPPPSLQWHATTAFAAPAASVAPPDDDSDLTRHPEVKGTAGERHNRPSLGAAAPQVPAADSGGSAVGGVDGIRHLPPKPQRAAPNFVELNKSRALAKDASPKGSYVERISKKKEVSEMLRDLAPGMRMPHRKAVSADDVSASAAPTAAAARQASAREQAAAPPPAAVVDEAQAAELWRQRASGLSATKGPKNSRGTGATAAPGAAPAGALHRRSSDSNINRPPHFVQPLPLGPKDFKPGERDQPRAAGDDVGGGGYQTAPFHGDASASYRLQSVVGPSAPAAPTTLAYAEVLYRPPPQQPTTFYQPPLLPLPHGYGGGFAGPYPASGYGPYFLRAPPPHVHPAFSLAQQDSRTSAALPGGAAFSTRQPPASFFHGPPPLPPSHFGPQAEQPQLAPYGGAYSSLPDLDVLQMAEAGLALTLPPPPPQAWSGGDVGSAAVATAAQLPPQLHAQLDAAGAGRLTHYATVPPIRTAPAATDGGGGSSSSYTQQYAQLREKEKRRGENPSYTAYTLSDYRKLEKEIKLGGLGPSLDPLTLREKNERRLRQLQYAKQAVEQQRAALETQKISKQQQQQPLKQRAVIGGGKGDEWDRGASSTPTNERQLEAASADEALSRRQAAMEYARSVPKPKVKARPKPDDSSSAASAGTQRDGRSSSAGLPLSDRERAPAVAAALVPLSKLGDTDLQMLHQRHQLEKMAVMELRKNARAAV